MGTPPGPTEEKFGPKQPPALVASSLQDLLYLSANSHVTVVNYIFWIHTYLLPRAVCSMARLQASASFTLCDANSEVCSIRQYPKSICITGSLSGPCTISPQCSKFPPNSQHCDRSASLVAKQTSKWGWRDQSPLLQDTAKLYK